jgi:anaerobic selenocysteine-containing dehydrogenase
VEVLPSGHIGRVHGSSRNPYTAGVICAKVARYAERQHHPSRLSQPLRRLGKKGDGRFAPISWEEALDEIATAFEAAEKTHGPASIWPYYYAGTMGLVQRDGINRLRHEKKYSRQKSTICSALADAGWRAGVGAIRGTDSKEIADADVIVVWGTNAVATQVNLMTHIAHARKSRGARLIVVDPYRNATAAQADMHLMVRPGCDAALVAATMHVLFAEGFADWEYLRRYTDCPDALAEHVQTRTPEWAETITGIPAIDIRTFARLYGSHPRSFIRIGYGMSRSRNGAANVHAVSCLPAITGAWKHRGGGALYVQSDMFVLDRSMIDGSDLLDGSVRSLDMSRIGPVLLNEDAEVRKGPPVTAMLIQNTNPAAVAPETTKVLAGLAREDLFLAVHEQFLTETARFADIVLPATTFLEHDDVYKAGSHSTIQISRRVIDPYAQARPNHHVICELARRLGCSHPGFAMSEWALIEDMLARSGLPDAETVFQRGGYDVAPDFETAHFLKGFPQPDGKFRFRPDWHALGHGDGYLPALPDFCPVMDAANPARPFRLVTAPARNFLNSTFTETPTSRQKEGRPELLIHSQDAAELDIEDGDVARVGNDRASIRLHCRYFSGLQRGVVVIESVWPNHCFLDGVGVNALTSAEPGLPGGGAVFHDTSVWIETAGKA